MQKDIELYNLKFKNSQPKEIIEFAINTWGKKLVIASSLGPEDQVITKISRTIDKNIRIFILDTGRLNPETYDLLAETQKKLHINYEVYYPDNKSLEEMVSKKGINLFYENIENRKECCHIRKVEPLKRVLKTAKAWITGQRKEQAISRSALKLVEWDSNNNMIKINPLANWGEKEVWDYIKEHEIPTNKLHKIGYPSIGCAPCTRPIKEGEDIRTGRWWWETPEQKECGLHVVNGKLVRKGESDGPLR